MGRFSPTVKPTAAPTGLGSLAQALQSGIAGYQGAQDRMEGQMDRQRKRVIETDTLASQGLVPNLPETPETFGSAFSRALSGAPEPETQPAVVPRAFLPEQGKFEDVDPITGQPQRAIQLPSGGFFNPAVMESRTAGMKMATGRADQTLGKEQRDTMQGELGAAVEEQGGPAVAARLPNAAGWLAPQTNALQFVPENYGSGARIFNRKTGRLEPVPGSTPLPRQNNVGQVRLSIGARRELDDMNYYKLAATGILDLMDNKPEGLGLQNLVGVKLTDRTDPQGVQLRTELMRLSNDIRNGLFGAALSEKEAELAAFQLADVSNTEESARVRINDIIKFADQKTRAIYESAQQSADFERTGRAPTTPPRQSAPAKRSLNNPGDYE